jgi:predicted  nucleic acid-binding Zn-ribbon protein
MKWLDRLLGLPPPDVRKEHEEDKAALENLHTAFDRVQSRSTRLELELRRINTELRRTERPR